MDGGADLTPNPISAPCSIGCGNDISKSTTVYIVLIKFRIISPSNGPA
jgi:hypothetical protein